MRVKMSKHPPPAPTASAVGPCPTVIRIVGRPGTLGEEKCHLNIFIGKLKVKVTLEGHINEIFWAITPTYMHGFQKKFAQVFSLKSRSAI